MPDLSLRWQCVRLVGFIRLFLDLGSSNLCISRSSSPPHAPKVPDQYPLVPASSRQNLAVFGQGKVGNLIGVSFEASLRLPRGRLPAFHFRRLSACVKRLAIC